MINLACKNITIMELITCAFNINKTEYNIIVQLLKKQNCSSESLAKKLGKNLTTIQKALKSLVEKDLVIRKQINLDGGGYKFIYQSISKDEIKSRIENNLKSFEEKVISRLESF
ncbi:MAG: helix-turn-helix domain-containing protein [Candidatus Woesearchaeota archaeon]